MDMNLDPVYLLKSTLVVAIVLTFILTAGFLIDKFVAASGLFRRGLWVYHFRAVLLAIWRLTDTGFVTIAGNLRDHIHILDDPLYVVVLPIMLYLSPFSCFIGVLTAFFDDRDYAWGWHVLVMCVGTFVVACVMERYLITRSKPKTGGTEA